MNTPFDAAVEAPREPNAGVPAPAAAATHVRPLYWSVRRELWENRSIYVVPLVAAAVALFGFMLGSTHLPARMRAVFALDPALQGIALAKGYAIMTMIIVFAAFIAGAFYCLEALHGERRDRTILFWKSLPVSDLTTVLSKASIPLVILPSIVFVIAVGLQIVTLLLSTAVLLSNGMSAATMWTQLPLLRMWVFLFYGLIVIALWHAPVYAWLLLVSGWARRTTFLWAVLPPLALCILEKLAFNSSHLAALLKYRLVGGFAEAFAVDASSHGMVERFDQLDPLRFLGSAGLWVGLAVAVAFLAAAVRLRRYRESI